MRQITSSYEIDGVPFGRLENVYAETDTEIVSNVYERTMIPGTLPFCRSFKKRQPKDGSAAILEPLTGWRSLWDPCDIVLPEDFPISQFLLLARVYQQGQQDGAQQASSEGLGARGRQQATRRAER